MTRAAREGFHRCVHRATTQYQFDLESALRDAHLSLASLEPPDQAEALRLFDLQYEATDWSDRESIRILVPLFEAAYRHCPRNFSSEHRYIDMNLGTTRLQMKNGRLLKLLPGQKAEEVWRYSKRNIVHYR